MSKLILVLVTLTLVGCVSLMEQRTRDLEEANKQCRLVGSKGVAKVNWNSEDEVETVTCSKEEIER